MDLTSFRRRNKKPSPITVFRELYHDYRGNRYKSMDMESDSSKDFNLIALRNKKMSSTQKLQKYLAQNQKKSCDGASNGLQASCYTSNVITNGNRKKSTDSPSDKRMYFNGLFSQTHDLFRKPKLVRQTQIKGLDAQRHTQELTLKPINNCEGLSLPQTRRDDMRRNLAELKQQRIIKKQKTAQIRYDYLADKGFKKKQEKLHCWVKNGPKSLFFKTKENIFPGSTRC